MEVNTIQLAAGLCGLALVVVGTIFALRYRVSNQSQHCAKTRDIVSGRTKTAAADISRLRGIFMLLGMIVSMTFSLLLVSWTQSSRPLYLADSDTFYEDVFVVEPPRTIERSKPKPPPPELLQRPEEVFPVEAITIPSIPEEIKINVEPDPDFPGIDHEVAVPVFTPTVLPEPEGDEIFIVVEEMPRFPGCEDLEGSRADRQACAETKLLQFIREHVKYPSIAKELGLQGKVQVHFIIEKDGTVGDAEILRDFGAGSGEEALRVVNLMNELGYRWTPGKQRGVPVRVQFTLPVSFKLH